MQGCKTVKAPRAQERSVFDRATEASTNSPEGSPIAKSWAFTRSGRKTVLDSYVPANGRPFQQERMVMLSQGNSPSCDTGNINC